MSVFSVTHSTVRHGTLPRHRHRLRGGQTQARHKMNTTSSQYPPLSFNNSQQLSVNQMAPSLLCCSPQTTLYGDKAVPVSPRGGNRDLARPVQV